ncbi:hypothetical protein Nepgr_023497 [Nepenthes gracilis]|uniref:Uncharacterized protein n=1 Tax=Nepenthes gracilis TaxID=150966 RepID=A0AAD3T2K1_NEPGR|nr:hypothetical protein Nepgr_023497 [Nepenthes gracilis]
MNTGFGNYLVVAPLMYSAVEGRSGDRLSDSGPCAATVGGWSQGLLSASAGAEQGVNNGLGASLVVSPPPGSALDGRSGGQLPDSKACAATVGEQPGQTVGQRRC